ncbi:MAG: Single-stranded DNA-binding protein [uncultured Sulfurovum sp.]|uniref:Single-stranded DNA-binding protein n=1 Tax=uncultured Sulfurovum sp. TaxID=269237 RepID=A0A6S6SK50_9BACT|nr:MAG: Single-stranded DNA-binding protein [uncultured Sulfurovum sp.]
MTMLGGRDEAQSGGYNTAPANDTYSQPAPQQETPSYGAPTQPAPQQNQASNIPEIDINEDEPF